MPKLAFVYDYRKEFEPVLCRYLGITPDEFHNYSNYWRVFLYIMGDEFGGNDGYSEVKSIHRDVIPWYEADVRKYYGESYVPMIRAINDTIDHLTDKYMDKILLRVSW